MQSTFNWAQNATTQYQSFTRHLFMPPSFYATTFPVYFEFKYNKPIILIKYEDFPVKCKLHLY